MSQLFGVVPIIFLMCAVFSAQKMLFTSHLNRSLYQEEKNRRLVSAKNLLNTTLPSLSELECAMACTMLPSCRSFNVGVFKLGSSMYLICELMNTDSDSLPGLVRKEENYSYFSHKKVNTVEKSCSHLRISGQTTSDYYIIDPDGLDGEPSFTVYCNMSDKGGAGVTIIGHDTENRTKCTGCEQAGCISRKIKYDNTREQLTALIAVSDKCEQYIKYECYGSTIHNNGKTFSWLVSRDERVLDYWGGADPGSGACACGMTRSCEDVDKSCNCDSNTAKWREDSGLLTHKADLPISELRLGDLNSIGIPYNFTELVYFTLGRLHCYNP